MSILAWLLLGHLLGDWLLQNDWMAQGKRQGLFTRAGLAHFSIYTLAILGVFWLFDDRNADPLVWLATGVIVFVTHLLIDATNVVRRWMRFYGQRDQDMVRIMIDQTLHLLVLGLLAVLYLGL